VIHLIYINNDDGFNVTLYVWF